MTHARGVGYTEVVTRRILLALGAVAIVLGLVACGGGVNDPLDPLALSAQKSADAGGVKMPNRLPTGSCR